MTDKERKNRIIHLKKKIQLLSDDRYQEHFIEVRGKRWLINEIDRSLEELFELLNN